jgi:hypothetical protein
MKLRSIATLLLSIGLLAPQWLLASDHIDGEITGELAVADLSDLYAFTALKRPGYLTLIMNSHPLAPASAHFADKLSYNFIVRQARLIASKVQTDTVSELRINCRFYTPEEYQNHTITCEALKSEKQQGYKVSGLLNQTLNDKVNTPLKLFAGLRSDAFFFNADWAKSTRVKGELTPAQDSNTMDQLNALSIVAELRLADFFVAAHHPLYAVASEIMTGDQNGYMTKRLDRLGRPEITNVTMMPNEDKDWRDRYNREAVFKITPDHRKDYQQKIVKNIKTYDLLDKKVDWSDTRITKLSRLLLDDHLLIDVHKPCQVDNYFSIEMALLNQLAYTSCGGRQIKDDFMDKLFSLYITGDHGQISDGVDAPYRRPSSEFPYLAEPDVTLTARLKGWVARLFL